MYKKVTTVRAALLGFAILSLGSCVDRDYDLSADNIDMTMQVLGDLAIPSSTVKPITLKEVLDLNAEGSCIKEAAQGDFGLNEGDYVLTQMGASPESSIRVPEVVFSSLAGSKTVIDLGTFNIPAVPPGVTPPVVPPVAVEGGCKVDVNADAIPVEVKGIASLETDVTATIALDLAGSNLSKNVYLQPGFTLQLPQAWEMEADRVGACNAFTKQPGNKFVLDRELAVGVNAPVKLQFKVSRINFEKSAGKDYREILDGKMNIKESISISGSMAVHLQDFTAAETADVKLNITSGFVGASRITAVQGVVVPTVKVDGTDFHLANIPDFLLSEDNYIQIDNPQIELLLKNTSPLAVQLKAKITSYGDNDKALANLAIGESQDFIIPAATPEKDTHKFVISRKAIPGMAANYNIVVPNLDQLLCKLPKRMSFHSVDVKALPQLNTYKLGTNYNFKAEFEAIIPLAFGPDATFAYETTLNEFGLGDNFEKFKPEALQVYFDVESSLPFDLMPEVSALDTYGNVMENLTVEFNEPIGPSATPKHIVITLKSATRDYKGFDGIKMNFKGKTAAGYEGKNINSNMQLKLSGLGVKILGGIIIDLNQK